MVVEALDVAMDLTVPFTSNVASGVAVPMPILPPVTNKSLLASVVMLLSPEIAVPVAV
jgi:hypothetical protein